jgi:predicted enzyme related to lactoylglutathione lyase
VRGLGGYSGAGLSSNAVTKVRICIDVPDVVRAVDFYTRTFGWKSISREGFVEIVGAPVPIDILPRHAGSTTAPPANATRTYERHWTPLHLDFVVDDVDTVVARAVNLGARLEAGPIDLPFARSAQLSDPFGHGLCILQMTARGYD